MRIKKLSLFLALMLAIGATVLPLTAYAAGGKDTTPPELTASLDGGTLKVESSDDNSGVEAVFVDGNRINSLTNGAAKVTLKDYAGTEKQVIVYAQDYAGNRSEAVKFDNPYYEEPKETEKPSAAPAQTGTVKPTQAPAASSGSQGAATQNNGGGSTSNKGISSAGASTGGSTSSGNHSGNSGSNNSGNSSNAGTNTGQADSSGGTSGGSTSSGGSSSESSTSSVPEGAFTPEGTGTVLDTATGADGDKQFYTITTEEACVLLTQKRNEKDYEFEIEVSLMIDSDRLFEDSRPTYTNIRKYVFDKYGVKLQLKDIADVKRDYGMKMKVNKHLIKGDEPVRRKCTPNKRKYIIEALKYYHAI